MQLEAVYDARAMAIAMSIAMRGEGMKLRRRFRRGNDERSHNWEEGEILRIILKQKANERAA